MLSLFIPGRPIAFARTRGANRYTPEPQASYMLAIGHIGRAAMSKAGYAPFEGPLEVVYRATYGWPESWPAKRRAGVRWKASKPDLDNNAKLVSDSLNGIAYRDDAQIVSLRAEKVYGLPEGATITITSLLDQTERADAA